MIRWGGVRPGLMNVGQGSRGGGASGQAKAKGAERGKKAGREGCDGNLDTGSGQIEGGSLHASQHKGKSGANGRWQLADQTRHSHWV